jgi:hypothetical protein
MINKAKASDAINLCAISNDLLNEALNLDTYEAWRRAADAAFNAAQACKGTGFDRSWFDTYERRRSVCRREAARAFKTGRQTSLAIAA